MKLGEVLMLQRVEGGNFDSSVIQPYSLTSCMNSTTCLLLYSVNNSECMISQDPRRSSNHGHGQEQQDAQHMDHQDKIPQ